MIFAFPTPMPRAGLLGLLLAIGMIWGGTFGLARTGGEAGIPALGYGFWFAFGVGAGLLALGLAQGSRLHILSGMAKGVLQHFGDFIFLQTVGGFNLNTRLNTTNGFLRSNA